MTADLERDLGALADRLRASTVAVASDGGSGSGVVWPRPGTVITNAHVARRGRVTIEAGDGSRRIGRVTDRDDARDLAAIAVDTTGLAPVEPRDPGSLRPGELVVAFGHPLGVRNVLTAGIVYGPHRSGSDRFVRADITLLPGNSGGPLADAAGRVLGINSMVAGGLALAVPSDAVAAFLGEAVPASGPRLGVRLAPVRVAGRQAYAVTGVERGSRAERAGILPGDIIVVRDIASLGRARRIGVIRGGVTLPIDIEPSVPDAAAA